jgi:hypothetical protein
MLSVAPCLVTAEESAVEVCPVLDIPGLDGAVSSWTVEELMVLTELVTSESLTILETKTVLDQLTESQRTTLGELLAGWAGIPLEEAHEAMETRREKEALGPCTKTERAYLWGCYPCEYAGSCARNPTLSDYWWDGLECGTADSDWLPHFHIEHSQNPDQLRWYTTSSLVYTCIATFNGLNLNSYAYSWADWNDVWLVVGKTAVGCAGQDRVKTTQYLSILCS